MGLNNFLSFGWDLENVLFYGWYKKKFPTMIENYSNLLDNVKYHHQQFQNKPLSKRFYDKLKVKECNVGVKGVAGFLCEL